MSSPKVKLSICIATFKRGGFIGETLDSILAQMQPGVELVVVDGASPDETPEVMARYLSRHPEIRYRREAVNSGVDQDYDKAVGYAAGEYCWLMSDDDLLKPGAVSRVLESLDGKTDLVVVNSEVKSADFSRLLDPQLLKLPADAVYDAGDGDRLFSAVAGYLSFIGGVVVRRALWLERDRASYYGSLFVHIGVLFQRPLARAVAIARPLITIRLGNGMWTPRGFEIWMFLWPRLVWSFRGYSDRAKALVCPREPWRNLRKLFYYRAMGGYSVAGYRRFIAPEAKGAARALSFATALVPVVLANAVAGFYFALKKDRLTLYALSHGGLAAWPARLAAGLLPPDEIGKAA